MLIYRVEKNGIGPYNTYHPDLTEMKIQHNKAENRPGIKIDTDYDINEENVKHYRCAFHDIESLKNWFKGYRMMLNRAGFVMNVYDVPAKYVRVANSTMQLAFYYDFAKLVKTSKVP